MSTENYINHPTFGLLFRICLIEEGRELFATLYAQRLFFIVSIAAGKSLKFETVGRSDARQMAEERLRFLRRRGEYAEYERLQKTYKQTFQ